MNLLNKDKIIGDYIIDNVFLGNKKAAESKHILEINNIAIVINFSNSRYKEYDNIFYFHFDIDDNPNENISQYFEKVNQIIKINKSLNILIHCKNAVSRSVTIVLAYLLTKMNLKDSFDFLKTTTIELILPNKGFYEQLLKEEKKIYGINTMQLYWNNNNDNNNNNTIYNNDTDNMINNNNENYNYHFHLHDNNFTEIDNHNDNCNDNDITNNNNTIN
jgi:protein-tyrosine phosphatase